MTQFAKSRRAAVVAAAGCGKTHLIAQAVAEYPRGRELILTHTHAGVHAIRARLSQFKARPSTYHVATIAGWALEYAASYPRLSGLSDFRPVDRNDWESVYSAASRLLDNQSIRKVVSSSYSGMYVDEYQDCLVLQHELILKLAELLPCRIVGNPLQSIFGFGGNKVVDWDKHVKPAFDQLPELVEPWRWKNASPELGQWLGHVRERLLRGEDIVLNQAP